jgi:hypothetical protein
MRQGHGAAAMSTHDGASEHGGSSTKTLPAVLSERTPELSADGCPMIAETRDESHAENSEQKYEIVRLVGIVLLVLVTLCACGKGEETVDAATVGFFVAAVLAAVIGFEAWRAMRKPHAAECDCDESCADGSGR